MTYDRNRPGGQWPPGQPRDPRPAYGIPRNHYGGQRNSPYAPRQAAYDPPGLYGMPRQAAYDPPREPYKVFREENHGHRVLSDTIEAFRGINPEAFRNPDFNEPLDVRNGNLEAFPDQGADRVVDSGRLELSPWLKSRMNGTMHVWNEYFASMPGLYVNCDEYGNEDPEAWQGKPPAGFVNNGEGNAFLHVVRTGVTPAPHPAPPSQEAYPRYAPEAYGKPPEPPRKPAQPAAGAPRPGGMRLNPPRV